MSLPTVLQLIAALLMIASLIVMLISPATGGPKMMRCRNQAVYGFTLGLALIIVSWFMQM
jgi:hypothetical protein